MSNSADPRLILEALSAHLVPSPLLSKLPLALELYTHLQLLSTQLKFECLRALAEQEVLATELSAREIPPVQWVRHGALNQKEGRRVKRWSERDKGGRMFGFSLEMRKHHLAKVFNAKGMIPERALQLLDTYFPDLPVQEIANELFIQSMTEEQRVILAAYRETTLKWYNMMKSNHAKGLPGPTLDSMTGSTAGDALDVLARNVMKEAESVVRDAEEFEAIFSGVSPDPKGEQAIKEEKEGDSKQALRAEEDGAASSHPKSTAGRQSLTAPLMSTSNSIRPPRERDDRRATIGYRPSGSMSYPRDQSADDRLIARSHPTHAQPSAKSEVSSRPKPSPAGIKTSSRRRSGPHSNSVPGYTRPVGHMGDNIPKELLRPFDGKQIKRSRASEHRREDELRGNKRAKVQGPHSAGYPDEREEAEQTGKKRARKALGDGDTLGNSQSSEESLRTKERRRVRKGKGRAA